MAKMDAERQARLKTLLMEEKRRLWNELRVELFAQTGEGLHAGYEVPVDIGDQGLLDLLEDTGLALADIRREQLTQMDEALKKLEKGSYGLCADCGEKIPEQRLKVAPYAICCVDCQQEREGHAAPPHATL